MSRIAVFGAGAWGTAIALSLAQKNEHEVVLWSHRAEAVKELNRDRQNRRFLPGYHFPADLEITANAADAASNSDVLISAVPSEFLRPTFELLASMVSEGQIVVSATKGIEDHSFLRMTEVIASCLRERGLDLPIGALSGPSFAQELAAGLPTAVAIAFANGAINGRIQEAFSSHSLRLYTNDDVIGVELGGALKNVIAIAAGALGGLSMGTNAVAGLITRGIAEITRLAEAAGGRRETLSGLSGLGDLVLTCTGSLSRNRSVGFELGRGRSLKHILAGLDGKVAEGVRTTRAAMGLARKLGVEMPITAEVEQILDYGKDARTAVRDLMRRPGRGELN